MFKENAASLLPVRDLSHNPLLDSRGLLWGVKETTLPSTGFKRLPRKYLASQNSVFIMELLPLSLSYFLQRWYKENLSSSCASLFLPGRCLTHNTYGSFPSPSSSLQHHLDVL